MKTLKQCPYPFILYLFRPSLKHFIIK